MYLKQVNKFIEHLVRREYLLNFIKKSLRKVDYRKRRDYIDKDSKPTTQPSVRPIIFPAGARSAPAGPKIVLVPPRSMT